LTNLQALIIALATLGLTSSTLDGSEAYVQTPWLDAARHQIGLNPRPDIWKSKWCGLFLASIMPGDFEGKRALAWLSYGRPSSARPGAIAVIARSPGKGHVGIVESCNNTHCRIVAGNGRGKVVDSKDYPRKRIIAFRWPETNHQKADADTAKIITMDEVSRVAADIAKLPELLKR
jgi:hypothetical protein